MATATKPQTAYQRANEAPPPISLNVGNLWTHSFLDKVIAWNREFEGKVRVDSLYGSVSGLTPTARSMDRIPHLTWDQAEAFVHKVRSHGIAIRYTLNASCIGPMQYFEPNWRTNLEGVVRMLDSIGVKEWTVTSPLILELLKDLFPTSFVEVSTIAEVATPEAAERWEAIGADAVNVSIHINRDFRTLGHINKALPVTVLANEACLYRCPWRQDCYNLSSHDSIRSVEHFNYYPFRRCNELRIKNPVEWLRARLVLPQWMKVYQELTGVNRFKITGRTHPESIVLPILRAYMEQYWGDNLCDLWPTIAHLGETREPKATTYISCSGLDVLKFLGHWSKWPMDGDPCVGMACGADCSYCARILGHAAHSRQIPVD